MLTDAETRYTIFERIALALRMASKRLRPHFQAHTIVVLSNYPIRTILHKPDALRRLLKWVVELSEFDIEYHPRSATKGQVLANFIVESCHMCNPEPKATRYGSWKSMVHPEQRRRSRFDSTVLETFICCSSSQTRIRGL